MKVVHIIIGLNVGGAELMLKRLVESHTSDKGIEHTVISLTDEGVIGPQLRKASVPVYTLGMKNLLGGLACFFRLRKLLKNLHPDIVHTWMYHADLIGGVAAYSAGFRNIIWCIRSTDIRQGGSRITLLVRKLCALLSFKIPTAIVCAAQASRRVHEAVGYDRHNILVIPNGFDLQRLHASDELGSQLRAELKIGADDILIGSIGRYSQVKDHSNLVKAAGLLASTRSDVCFLLIGRGLVCENVELMQQIEATGFSERFVLLGERRDIPVCLKAMDLFCLHSKTEGFPNVLGEAMAMGVPCVTTDVGDAAYLLDQPERVVPSADPVALSAALLSLVTLDKSKRAELGAIGHKRIVNCFTLDLISQRYADLYNTIIKKLIV